MLHFVSNLFYVSRSSRWHLRSIMWMNIRASFGVKALCMWCVCVCVSMCICLFVCAHSIDPRKEEVNKWMYNTVHSEKIQKYNNYRKVSQEQSNHNGLSLQYFLCYRCFKNIWWWFKQVNLPAHQCIVNLHIQGCLAQGQSAESVMKVQNLVIFSYIHVQSTYFLLRADRPLCGLFWDLPTLEIFCT